MTQTPASGPLAPVTTPPISVAPITTSGARACCEPSDAYALTRHNETVTTAIQRWAVFCFTTLSFGITREIVLWVRIWLILEKRVSLGSSSFEIARFPKPETELQ